LFRRGETDVLVGTQMLAKGRYRFRFLMLASDTALLRDLDRRINEAHKKLRSPRTRLTVDMDALSMM